jgi:hypothetical protein
MSEFTLEDRGDGHFALSGEMTFDTAEKILAASGDMFDEHTQLEVDLSEVTERSPGHCQDDRGGAIVDARRALVGFY